MVRKEIRVTETQLLRERAEALVRHDASRSPVSTDALSRQDLVSLITSLRVSRIELELENEELRRENDARRENEERYRAIVRAIPDLIFIYSGDGYCLDFHAHSFDLLVVQPEVFLGRHMSETFPKSLAGKFQRCFDEALRSGQPQVMDYSLEMPGGNKEFEARVSPMDGQRVLAIVRDVTERAPVEGGGSRN